MMPSNVSPSNGDPSVSSSKKGAPQPLSSGKPARNRGRTASSTQFGPRSSPIAPAGSGLSPDQPRVRSSSIPFPAQDTVTFKLPNTDSNYPEGSEDAEIETPTRKSRPRATPKSLEPTKPREPSPDLQVVAPEIRGVPEHDKIKNVRPSLGSSHTSPEMHKSSRSRSQRPNRIERSASEPVTPLKKLSGLQLDGKIAKLINNGPKGDKTKENEIGSIYFFTVKPQNCEVRLLKIGRTQKYTDERLNQIQGICKHVEIDMHPKAVAQDIPFHGFAEKLIHMELGNYQHQFQCVCTKRHKEYFQVSEDVAVRVFERWRDFCQEEPWDKNGKIMRKWARRLRNRAKFSGSESHNFDHHDFARPWDAFTYPTSFERFLSDAILVWELGFPNRWLIISLAELLTIVCISRHSFWTSTWTTVIILFLLLDLIVTDNMHTTTHISQLMEGGLQSFLVQQTQPADKPVVDVEEVISDHSQENTPRREISEEAPSEFQEDSDEVETRQGTDGENDTQSRVFTDMGDNSDEDSEPFADL